MQPIFGPLASYLGQLPVFLVWLVAIIVAIVNWRRHPRVSLLTLIAFAMFFIAAFVGTALTSWLPLTLHERGLPGTQMGNVALILSFLRGLFDAAAWVLLVFAIFGWRRERPPTELPVSQA
jgi:hypothetical protein